MNKKTHDFDQIILDVISCKWTKKLLLTIKQEINRPGEIRKHIAGLSTKVMNESLKRLLNYNMVTKTEYDELPLRVEYSITEFGQESLYIIEQVDKLKAKYTKY